MLKLPVKLVVIAFTLALFGMGAFGVYNLEADYNSVWYMRENSYQKRFFEQSWEYFPEFGERVHVYVGDVPFWEHIDELKAMSDVMHNTTSVNEDSLVFWFPDFYDDWCVLQPEQIEEFKEFPQEDLYDIFGINCSDGERWEEN